MKRIVAVFFVLLLISGCATMTPARYSMSADNQQALKQFKGVMVELVNLAPPANYDANCRMIGPIKAADGTPINDFVKNAFNDEFKFANIYSTSGVKLQGVLTQVEFSSSSGLTNGWWKLGIKLTSSNGATLEQSSRTNFKSGFGGISACNNTAEALGGAVQDLIHETFTNPYFSKLLQK
ncbi:MAG: hypothetical protein PF483_01060 [Halothiobacillus sp.]|jgi:hypothetical protein|nr:hypothetical protein [Halothiobacillus sp.]